MKILSPRGSQGLDTSADRTFVEQSLFQRSSSPIGIELRAWLGAHTYLLVLGVALFAGAMHMLPFWYAQFQTPSGWVFTGSLSTSPDEMQYRIWARQTQADGIIVDNRFTSEPSKPYLPVIFYYLVGQLARTTQLPPEFVNAYAGSIFAFLFVVLLFFTVQQFSQSRAQTWWTFLVILLGGGLGAHLKLLEQIGTVRTNPLLSQILLEPLYAAPVFEEYRWHYVYITLFDTHFLLIWLLSTAAVLALYFTIKRFSIWRLALTASMYALVMLLHIYEGLTFLCITAGVTLILWRKGMANRTVWVTLGVCGVVVFGTYALLALLYRNSGLPLPTWRAPDILLGTLLIAFPLAWILIALGIARYWRSAGFKESFLMGWALGCTALTLSSPFYRYADRGTLTLQIPLYVIAGTILFLQYTRWVRPVTVLAILLLAATPLWMTVRSLHYARFDPTTPVLFMDAAHRGIVQELNRVAVPEDVLLVNKSEEPWKDDDLWLAPDYPGKHFSGHYFLTVDYERKRNEVLRFFESSPGEQNDFLTKNGIRFLYVAAAQDPERFKEVSGLVLLRQESMGTLFEFKSD